MVSVPLESREKLVYLDAALTSVLPCRSLSCERKQTGRLRISGSFFNEQNRSAECQVKVKFLGADGSIAEETNWMPIVFPRRELTQFEHTSLTTRADDFVLMLRVARIDEPK